MEDLEFPNTITSTASAVPATGDHLHLSAPTTDAACEDTVAELFASDESYYIDSNCSTPYVSAPSSPGRAFDGGCCGGGGGGYFYSAPASPTHYVLSTASLRSSGFVPSTSEASETGKSGSGSVEFEFSARFAASYNDLAAAEIGSMSSADELFLNGQIRPLKLYTHLQRPQVLAPLVDELESDGNGDSGKGMGDVEEKDFDRNGENVFFGSRDLRLWNKSIRRRTRSLSPLRNTTSFDWSELVVKGEDDKEERLGQQVKMMLNSQNNGDTKGAGDEIVSNETTPSASASSSRCSSAGRSSKRWVFLKDFLRSKSEGRSNHKFWTNISFSPAKEKKSSTSQHSEPVSDSKKKKTSGGGPVPENQKQPKKSGKESAKKSPASAVAGKPANGVGKRRVPLSAHELHYTANRAQAEEMRKKTYLPYRQGLLGCLGFSSKSYGAMNGLARALNPVSSR